MKGKKGLWPDSFIISPEEDGTYTVIFKARDRRCCALPNVIHPEGIASLRQDVERHFYIYYAHARTLHEELCRIEEAVRAILKISPISDNEGEKCHDERN